MTPPKTRQQAKLSTGCPRVPARRLRESRGSPKRALECGSSAAAFTAKAQAELAHSKARRLHCSIPGSHGRAPERLCLIPGRTPLNAYTPLSVKLLLPPRQSRGISQPIRRPAGRGPRRHTRQYIVEPDGAQRSRHARMRATVETLREMRVNPPEQPEPLPCRPKPQRGRTLSRPARFASAAWV